MQATFPYHDHGLITLHVYRQVHYDDVIMTTIASQITSLTGIYSTVYSDADQRKYQSTASLTFVCGIHRDRWIPRTKGQLRGKCFHFMTSSWFIMYPQWLCDKEMCKQRSWGWRFETEANGRHVADNHFLNVFIWQILCFDSNFTEFCCQGPN